MSDDPRAQPPVVSVVIPARDAAGYLTEALGTAQAQTLRDIEILVIDDGSRDATWQLLLRASLADPRIRPIRRRRSGGVSAARNIGIAEARGHWLALLDADDLWMPERLARLVPQAEALGADMLADDLLVSDFASGKPRGRMFGSAGIPAGALTPEDVVARDMPDAPEGSPGAIGYAKPLLRRAFLLERGLRFDPALSVGEDLAFYFACVAAGARFRMVDDALYVYRQRSESASRRRAGVAAEQAEANRRMAQLARGPLAGPALPMLLHRQDLLDQAAVAEAAADGSWLAALSRARWTRPGRLLRDLRLVAGAARRRLHA